MLKMTKIELELIPSPHMFMFFEKAQKVEFLIFLTDIAKAAINI